MGDDNRSAATTTDALAALPLHAWTVFHDLHWPSARYDGVSHVVVGPGGVFVVGEPGTDPAVVGRATMKVASMIGPEVAPEHVHPVAATEPADLVSLMVHAPVALSPQQVTHVCLTLDWSVLRRD